MAERKEWRITCYPKNIYEKKTEHNKQRKEVWEIQIEQKHSRVEERMEYKKTKTFLSILSPHTTICYHLIHIFNF
jgi:hypothetical protein